MKKVLIVILILVGFSASVFAQILPISISAGGGAYLDVGALPGYNYDDTAIGAGGFAFVDFTYAEFSVGFGYFGLADANEHGSAMNLSLLGKYPFDLEHFTLFPLLGARLYIPFSQSKVDDFDTGDYMRLGIQVGGGIDYPFSDNLFLRASALLDILFYAPGKDPYDDTLYSVGPTIKIGVGYKF